MKRKILAALLCGLMLFLCACKAQTSSANEVSEKKTDSSPLPQSEEGQYSGCLAGLVESDEGSDLIVFDPETMQAEKITTLKNVWMGMPNALSPNGRFLAYANYLPTNSSDARIGESMELYLLNLETEETTPVLCDPKGQQVESIRWLPDNQTIIFSMCVPQELYLDYLLYSYNVSTGERKLLDSGMTQTDVTPKTIEEQEKKYHQTISVPLEIDDTFFFTTLKNPAVSPDGTKVLYTTSFHRRATPSYDQDTPYEKIPQLWLLSGLWCVSADGEGTPQLLYSNPDARSNTGRAVWSQDGSEIYFSRYYDGMGECDCGIERLNLQTGKTDVLLKQMDSMRTNRVCAALEGNRLLFCSKGEEGQNNYVMDTTTGKYEPFPCTYQGKELSLTTFRIIEP